MTMKTELLARIKATGIAATDEEIAAVLQDEAARAEAAAAADKESKARNALLEEMKAAEAAAEESHTSVYRLMEEKHAEIMAKLEEVEAAKTAAAPYIQATKEKQREAAALHTELKELTYQIPEEARRPYEPETAGTETFVDTMGTPVIRGKQA